MRTFTHAFEVGGKQTRFLFSPVITKEAAKYFVTVAGLGGQIFNFEIRESRPAFWQVLSPAPLWVRAMEAELGQLLNIKNNLIAPETFWSLNQHRFATTV